MQDLSREIETHISERNRDQLKLEPGSRCYARASDGVLYRALVVTMKAGTTATVYFTDYGNSEEVEISDMYSPTGSYFDLPTQGLFCTLSDFIPKQSQWSDTIREILVEKLLNQEVHGMFRSISSNLHPYSDAVLQDSGGGCYPSYNVTLFQDEVGAVSHSSMLVSIGLGQFAICNENVSVGTTTKVFVAFSDSPGRFWLQLATASPTLEVIAVALADEMMSSSLKPLPREAVYTGVACCVVYVEDGILYRANIIEVKGSKVEVQFVDYGSSTTVSTGDLLELPASLAPVPAQAIQCCLEGVRPVKKDWTPESCDAFANGTINVELDSDFVDELTPEVFTVVLRNPETGSTISEMLVSGGCATSSNVTSVLGEPPNKMGGQGAIQQSLPKEYTAGGMEVGQTYEITITHLESPSVAWAQLTAHEGVFHDVMKNMSTLFKDADSIPGLQDPNVGQPCTAQFADDGKWYRGEIEAIHSKRARVLFVDFGNTEVFKISALKQLQPELILLPTQAVSFSMHTLVPADGGVVWPVKTVSSFMKMASSAVLKCEVVEHDSDGYPAVRLKDGRGRDIGEELVKMGLASWKEEARKSRSYQQNRPSSEGSTRGAREGSGRSGGSRERNARGSGSGGSSTRGSTSASRDASARGNTPPSQTQSSPHGNPSNQRSSVQTKNLSPLHTVAGPRQSKQQHYSTLTLEVGKSYGMTVIYVDSLQDFYVQLSEHEPKLTALMDEIATYCSSDEARMPDNLAIGQPVLAQFTDDQDWYRAMISKRDQGISVVTFVDYGNQDTLRDSSLVAIPPSFLSLPAQAIRCSLDGVGVQVSPEAAKTTFNDLTLEQEASGVVKSVLHDSSGPVYTVDLSLSDGSKPVTTLVEGGHISIPRATLSNLSPSSSPTLTEVKVPSFPVNTQIDVCISYVESPAKFFVQLLDDTCRLEELTREMNEIYSPMSQRDEVLFSLNAGVFCAARFSEDNVWYRARIISVGGATAKVRFVDYGNEEEVPASDLKSLRIQFAVEACLAIQCHLDSLPPKVATSPDVIETFSQFTAVEKQIIGKFLKPFTSYSVSVPIELFDASLPQAEQNVAKFLQGVHLKAGQTRLQDKPVTAPVQATSSAPCSKVTLPRVQPALNQPIECIVTHVENPDEIYCQPVSSTPLAEALLGQLYDFYAEKSSGIEVERPEIGTVCAAPFTDGSWYRVRVTVVKSGEATVQYLDYGNSAEVATTELRELDPKFLSEPQHALKCSLNGIQPMGSSRESVWTAECCTSLNETVVDQNCTVTVLSVRNDLCTVEMSVAGSNVAQNLIRDGFAVASAEPPKPVVVVADHRKDDTLAIPPFSGTVGSEIEVFVTFCDFPRILYCQPTQLDDRFEQLTQEIQRHCESASATVIGIDDVRINDIILAQYSEDMAWYRAQVKEIAKESLKVLFVDYGNSEETKSLCEISAKFCSLPVQAAPCTILNSEKYWIATGNEAVFNNHLTSDDGGFCLKFVEVEMTGEKSVVQLTRLSDGLGALEQACEAGILVSKIGGSIGGCAGHENGTKEQSLPPFIVETNAGEEGFVSHIESPSSFWIQFSSNESELDSLTELLAAEYGVSGNLSKLALPDPKPGQVCSAKFSTDLQWYRGVVDSVGSNGVKVHFVDYGNSEVVSPALVKVLKEEILEIPVQAVQCSLIGIIPPTGQTWSDESISGFSSLVLENAVAAEFVNESEKGVWSVMLTCLNKDVATAMMDKGFAVSKLQPMTKPFTEPPSETLPTEQRNFETGSESAPVIMIPDLVLKEGESYEVYISHMKLSDSPREFYCQLTNNEATVDELMASVSDFYAEESPPATLEVGRYCAAKYSVNDAWHRAKIIEINGSEGGETVTVQFVDFGNCEVVSPSRVLGLSPALATLAKQAVCCSLVADLNLHLPDESIARFLQTDTELCYRILVTGILENGRYLVQLSDFDGEILNHQILNSASESPIPTTDPSTLLFKTLSYPISSTIDVYVSFLNSPSSFYCQPLALAADLEAMMEELAGVVTGGSLEGLESACPGTYCLAQFSDDNEWYRARVESVSDNGTDVVVHFVDYGNSESTSLSALLKCPPSLFRVPVQALHCSVFDSGSTAGVVEWTDDKVEEFRGLLGDEALSLTVLKMDGDLCICSLSSNGSPIDFSPLLSSLVTARNREVGVDLPARCPQVVAPGNQLAIESEPMYASSASSSSLPPTAVRVTTSEGKTSEHSAGTSDDGRGASTSSQSLLPDGNLGPSSKSNMNFSTLALQGSASGENLSDTDTSEEASDQGDGEGEPLIKAPFTLNLSVQENFEAMVVYVESPSFLFLQRLDCQSELEKLSHEIEQYCTSFAEKQHQEMFQEGDFVLAQYTDQVWYRAKVIESGADTSFKVFFIDFGNSETIPPAKMVMCPENYLELPCQAIACSLANVPRRDSWPKEYKNLIDEQVSERVVKVKVVHPASKGMRPTVNIEDRETGADVAQTVLNYLHDECEQGNLSNYVIPEESGEVEASENPDQVTPKIDVTANDQPQLAEIVKGSQAARSTAVPQKSLDIGSTYDVYVASCDSPHSFFVQLASESESLDEMSAALESAYENVDTSQLVLPGPPIVGDYVCGQYTEDLKWYRAKVLGFNPSDSSQAELLFIDYGNREMGDVSNLRTLSPTLPSQPPFALECFLAGVEPPEGQGSFGADASQHVLELTGHAESVCKIEVKFADSAGHYGVNLGSDEGVNVAQSLIDGNLATALQDTPTTAASSSKVTPEQSEPMSSGAPPPHQSELPLSVEEPLAVGEEDKVEENASDMFSTSYPSRSLVQGSTHNAVVTSITSLDEFHCQLTDEINQLEELMEQIASRGYQIGSSDLEVTQPRKGMAVCACYTEEDVWYRAEVSNNVLPRGRVRVTYVDYGNCEEVDMTRVRKLEKEFADALAPLIVTCSLVPLTDRDIDPSRPPSQEAWTLEWPKKCLVHFQEMIGEEGEVRLVVEGSGCVEGEEGRGVRVRVLVSGEGGEIDVRKSLVERFRDPRPLGQELLQASEEADGGYGDSVTEEGGGGEGGVAEETDSNHQGLEKRGSKSAQVRESSLSGKCTGAFDVERSSFEDRLEEMVKEVAGLAIAEAQRDLKVNSSGGEAPCISRED